MTKLNCSYYESHACRSCSMLQYDLAELYQKNKQNTFETLKKHFPSTIDLKPFVFSDLLFQSRSKAKLLVSGTSDNPCIGLLQYDGKNKPLSVELLDCPLHITPINKLLHGVKALISTLSIDPYDVEQRTGELKGILIKANGTGSELILRFVLRSTQFVETLRSALETIQQQFPAVKVVTANIQPIPHAITEGPEEIILTEEEVITELYGDTTLFFGPQSFSQVTHNTAQKLYQRVADTLDERDCSNLLDLFCGVGGFSLLAANTLKSATGIEVSEDAVDCARKAAEYNNYTNCTFHCGDVFEELDKSIPAADAVLCNPPRRGLGSDLLAKLPATRASTFIYSSCNPVSFLKDYETLKADFTLLSIEPFDMFPLTKHVELLGVFARK